MTPGFLGEEMAVQVEEQMGLAGECVCRGQWCYMGAALERASQHLRFILDLMSIR